MAAAQLATVGGRDLEAAVPHKPAQDVVSAPTVSSFRGYFLVAAASPLAGGASAAAAPVPLVMCGEVKSRSSGNTWASTRDKLRDFMYPLSRGGQLGGAPRLDALDAMRWVGSIQIVMHHTFYYRSELPQNLRTVLRWGAMWTQLFFLLSGFILAYVEFARGAKAAKQPSLLQYLRRRLTVIYPAYMFALALRIAQSTNPSKFALGMLPLHIGLMQAWLPIVEGEEMGPYHNAWLPEAWFLSVLVLYWMLLRPLTRIFRNRGMVFCLVTIFLCWAFSLVPYFALHDGQPFTTRVLGDEHEGNLSRAVGCKDATCWNVIYAAFKGGPLGYFHVFVAGVAASRVFFLTCMQFESGVEGGGRYTLKTDGMLLIFRYGCCLGYASYAIAVWKMPFLMEHGFYFFHSGGMLPIMLLILMGAAAGHDPVASWIFLSRPMLTLGKISYLQYLLQLPVGVCLGKSIGWGATYDKLYVPLLLATAYCCQRWVERPYSDYQRWR